MFGFSRKQPAEPTGPDFSAIDSRAKAEELVRRGELEKLFLMPVEFGGEDTPQNTLFVPIGIARIKWGVDNNVVKPLVAEGKVSKYTATPEYHGRSFIPIAIKIVAYDPADFSTTINIWGEALQRG
jgi:hypothetical protein